MLESVTQESVPTNHSTVKFAKLFFPSLLQIYANDRLMRRIGGTDPNIDLPGLRKINWKTP